MASLKKIITIVLFEDFGGNSNNHNNINKKKKEKKNHLKNFCVSETKVFGEPADGRADAEGDRQSGGKENSSESDQNEERKLSDDELHPVGRFDVKLKGF